MIFFQFFITCKRTNNANNAIHYVRLGKKRRESSKRNYYIISPRVIIKAIIIIVSLKNNQQNCSLLFFIGGYLPLGVLGVRQLWFPTSNRLETWLISPRTNQPRQYHESTMVLRNLPLHHLFKCLLALCHALSIWKTRKSEVMRANQNLVLIPFPQVQHL